MAKTPKYTIRKYEGDDQYSWAVFRSEEVKGRRGIIFYGEAKPLFPGSSKSSAEHERNKLNAQ